MLQMFDGALSYQLTWAKWLHDELLQTCSDIEADFIRIGYELQPLQMATKSEIDSLTNGLITLTNVEEGKEEDFAKQLRDTYDAEQQSSLTAVAVVETGISIAEPPADCPESSFRARE